MVFELLGRTLLHEIQDRGALEVSETKRCAACLLECLAFVHDEVGVLHTDVKPENVLLAGPAPVGRVKLVDLGTAFYVGRQGARDIQTREYRCPEGVLGLWPFGPAADVWSVGCLVFELLTGGRSTRSRRGRGPSARTSRTRRARRAARARARRLVRRSPRAARCSAATGRRSGTSRPRRRRRAFTARVSEQSFAFARRDARDAAAPWRAPPRYEPGRARLRAGALLLPWPGRCPTPSRKGGGPCPRGALKRTGVALKHWLLCSC